MKTIKITGAVLQSNFLAGLEEICSLPLEGKAAYAVMKNYQQAVRLMRKIEDARMEVIRANAQKDDKGEIEVEELEDGQRVAKMADEVRERVDLELQELLTKKLYDLDLHMLKVDQLISSHTPLRPAVLIMIQPMLLDDGEAQQGEPVLQVDRSE